jgi:hypothetical protein
LLALTDEGVDPPVLVEVGGGQRKLSDGRHDFCNAAAGSVGGSVGGLSSARL